MTYRSLLVHLDQDPRCGARTQAALRLAKELDCHLVGVAPTGLLELPIGAEAELALADYTARAWDLMRDQAERATDRFREACHAAGVKSFEAVVDEADRAVSLVRHAHCSDLVVLTQADPSAADHRATRALVEQVVLYSARPTLILPYAGRYEDFGRQALVAWDDSREAARAVSDALPLLRRAHRVRLVGWTEAGADDQALRTRLGSLHQWLMWQGVTSEMGTEPAALSIADAILSRAADLGSDLIVMGAYGHSRLAERVLGGATRGVLATMTVPVLMSH